MDFFEDLIKVLDMVPWKSHIEYTQKKNFKKFT